MLTIPILQGILNEYGLEGFTKRINKVLNIKLPIKDFNQKVTYTKDSITINGEHPITITMEEEIYKITTEFNGYRTTKFYYNGELIRTLYLFNTEDEKLLALDYIDNGNFQTTRISKTTEEDKDFNKGEFEREVTTFPIIPINVDSYYLKNETKQEEERTIDLAGLNLYYHHYQGDNNTDYYQESAICKDIPYVKISGHLRLKDDLLVNSLNQKRPNIMIRGINVDEEGKPLEFYHVFIDFTDTGLVIKDVIMDNKNHVIDAQEDTFKIGCRRFNSNLLKALIVAIPKAVRPSHLTNVLEELEHLREALLLHEHKKLRDLDSIELMMKIIPDPDHLALSIYENQSKYENAINSLLEEPKSKSLK